MNARFYAGISLLLCSFLVLAGPGSVRKQVESSMLVTGTVHIEPDGSVSQYVLDQSAKLPEGVVKLVGSEVPKWQFAPIVENGVPVKAKAKMSLRIVASKLDAERFALTIRGADFGGDDTPGASLSQKKMAPPEYPASAWGAGISGTVYLVMRVGRQGTVEDVIAEQVNLTVVGTETEMTRGRNLLAKAALRVAKSWTFNIPIKGKQAEAEFWSARVAVNFMFDDQREPRYGEWAAYIPGPSQRIPWMLEDLNPTLSPDARLAGGVYQIGNGPRLLTPLDPG